MTNEYKTKESAYRAVAEDEDFYTMEYYCPLLKNRCRSDCICFNHPTIENNKKGKKPWKVSKDFGCGNAMFTGGSR